SPWRDPRARGDGREGRVACLLAGRQRYGLEARDAVFDAAAVTFFVRAPQLDAVVEYQARHLERGALALGLAIGIEEAGAEVDLVMAFRKRVGAVGNLEAGEALGNPADQGVHRLRRLGLLAIEEQAVEAAVVLL